MGPMPEPSNIERIGLMYSLNKFFGSRKEWLVKGLPIDQYIPKLTKGIRDTSSPEYHKLNLYFLYRAMHQANEACNKLWATVETYYHVNHDECLCKRFSSEFLASSTIPNLHYANMSALISLLSLYGVCSWVQKGRKIRYFNIIRTGQGLFLVERVKWLTGIFGNSKTGWHTQVLQTYEGLLGKGLELPNIDLKGSKELLRERTTLHYDVLGQTSMHEIHGTQVYLKFIPIVVSSTNAAIRELHQVIEPLPNGCDGRFAEIAQRIPTLEKLYPANEA
jgi:hypothetical protein